MYCPNEKCYGRNIETAIKFFTIAQIDGFGDKKIAQIANDFIDGNIPIFFKMLDVNVEQLLGLEGWAEISANARQIADMNQNFNGQIATLNGFNNLNNALQNFAIFAALPD